ncbi:acetyltransferase [Pseudomonas defluvii]|nr:acetyltransferase [Pseudomonas defluvii]
MKKLAVLGASGHGKVVADTAECCGWTSIEFFDDSLAGHNNGFWPIVGDTPSLLARLADFDGVIVAIGDNRIRHAKLLVLHAAGARLVSLIHPAASVSRYAFVGEGSVVFAGAVVNADARLGWGAILNTGCSVDHDCLLGACVHISPGSHLAGGVKVGDFSWIGIGASVRQLASIGSGVMVGCGAAVVTDLADDVTVVGVPARVLN